jgi:hypothetical protein
MLVVAKESPRFVCRLLARKVEGMALLMVSVGSALAVTLAVSAAALANRLPARGVLGHWRPRQREM